MITNKTKHKYIDLDLPLGNRSPEQYFSDTHTKRLAFANYLSQVRGLDNVETLILSSFIPHKLYQNDAINTDAYPVLLVVAARDYYIDEDGTRIPTDLVLFFSDMIISLRNFFKGQTQKVPDQPEIREFLQNAEANNTYSDNVTYWFRIGEDTPDNDLVNVEKELNNLIDNSGMIPDGDDITFVAEGLRNFYMRTIRAGDTEKLLDELMER